jgi:hypothetical protein
MPVKLGTLLEKQLKKVGVDTTSDELKALLEIDTEVPDDVAGKLDKGLLSLQAAKSNSEVRNAIKAETLAGADSKMDELIIEMGLQPGEDFANNKNTYDKIVQLTKLAHESGKKANGSTNKQTVDEFAKKEADYNKQIKDLKDGIATKETEFKTTRDNDLTTFELQKILLGKDYVFPKEMDTNLKVTTALGAVQNELTKKGFSIKRNDTGQLVIVNKEGQPAYSETNEALEPTTFIDGALAQNKLLKINDSNQQQQQSSGSGGAAIQGNQQLQGNNSIVAEIEAQINALK